MLLLPIGQCNDLFEVDVISVGGLVEEVDKLLMVNQINWIGVLAKYCDEEAVGF